VIAARIRGWRLDGRHPGRGPLLYVDSRLISRRIGGRRPPLAAIPVRQAELRPEFDAGSRGRRLLAGKEEEGKKRERRRYRSGEEGKAEQTDPLEREREHISRL